MGESDVQGEMRFIDTQTNKVYWQEYFEEIVDLVNEQQTTIQEQDRRIKELERMLKKCDAERIRLQNEKGSNYQIRCERRKCMTELDIITCVFMLLQTFALFMIAYK